MNERNLNVYTSDMTEMIEIIMADKDNYLFFTKEALAMIIEQQYDEINSLKEFISKHYMTE